MLMELFGDTDKNGGWGMLLGMMKAGQYNRAQGDNNLPIALRIWIMELCACIEGVRGAEAVGVREIILETSLGDEFRVSVLGGLVHELKDLLAEHFILPQVKFVPRECNRVAHELASIGSMCTQRMPSVMAGVPDCILHLVSNNSASVID
jgi:hypothetical protein